ncbi:unnamed protein product [Nyctereutes procyonoides]|uniref:(raccoon dog) hypothetical protein n=1 Tax=Nyctereutes procyonoides TaxID=34880 RepID=A0A811ZMN9_NYCPR|nr:unnamed protein product [Nyctereutes procyonoides]
MNILQRIHFPVGGNLGRFLFSFFFFLLLLLLFFFFFFRVAGLQGNVSSILLNIAKVLLLGEQIKHSRKADVFNWLLKDCVSNRFQFCPGGSSHFPEASVLPIKGPKPRPREKTESSLPAAFPSWCQPSLTCTTSMDTEDSGLISQPWRDLAATKRPQETQNGSGGGIYWFYCPKERAEKSRTYLPRRKHPGQQWPDSRVCPRQHVLGPRPSSNSWRGLSVDPVASCVAAAAHQAGEAEAQPSVTEHPLLP